MESDLEQFISRFEAAERVVETLAWEHLEGADTGPDAALARRSCAHGEYEGGWVGGKREGVGTMVFTHGARYEG